MARSRDKMSDLGASIKDIDWSAAELRPFEKVFYDPSLRRDVMSADAIHAWRAEHGIKIISARAAAADAAVAEADKYPPLVDFADSQLPDEVLKEIVAAKFTTPTPIQAQAFPIAMSGRNIIGIAKTGSGKTLAFIVPALVHIRAQPPLQRREGPIALVLAPTRELAVQIQQECSKFGRLLGVRNTCLYGGAPRGPQVQALQRGIEIAIATPGRLLDFLECHATNLNRVTYVVLDEADRMLDMGFEPQLRSIMAQIRPDRQMLFFSATWPNEVRRVAEDWVGSTAIRIAVGGIDDMRANADVTQIVDCCSKKDKWAKFEQVMGVVAENPRDRIIIFTATKRMADVLEHDLGRAGFRAAAIHGDKSQAQRDYVLRQFKLGSNPIMIATDVAARGLDVKDVRYVLNFDFGKNIEDYVHRIGRTGRAGARGIAYSFFCEDDHPLAPKLVQILEKATQKVPTYLAQLGQRNRRYGGGGSSRFFGKGQAQRIESGAGGSWRSAPNAKRW